VKTDYSRFKRKDIGCRQKLFVLGNDGVRNEDSGSGLQGGWSRFWAANRWQLTQNEGDSHGLAETGPDFCYKGIVKLVQRLGNCLNRNGDYHLLCVVVTANVLSSLILVTLMMEALLSFETSVLTRATQHVGAKFLRNVGSYKSHTE
jgi:hypothetical protein